MSEPIVPVLLNETATLNLTDDNKSALISLAIKSIVDGMASHYYYYSGEFSWLVNENTFDAIWNDYSGLRNGLVNVLINCHRHNSYYNSNAVFSQDYSNTKLISIENMLLKQDDVTSDSLRRTIVPIVYPDFNYKSEIIRLLELERDQSIINPWIDLASNHSKDEELFEFLLSNIKRGEGATELKVNILSKAFSIGVICESAVKKIANSAPISLRRTVVNGLVGIMRQYRTDFRYNQHTKEQEKSIMEKRDKVENLAMLFAALNDRQILRDLGASLSVKNLPWILPAAANHPWIVKDIQRRIDREGV